MYYEPFLGSGGVLGTLNPSNAIASDVLKPLMEIWFALRDSPEMLKQWYAERRDGLHTHEEVKFRYLKVLHNFNMNQNGADFVFLSRTCYGGVIRFRRSDGGMSTPCGAHMPIPSSVFSRRVDLWHRRVSGTRFVCADYREIIAEAKSGDVVYCDPPYSDSQSILYGAQAFQLHELIETIDAAKSRGVHVVLSIDGSKKSGLHQVLLDFPPGLFETEASVSVGRSMLRRFQMLDRTLQHDEVKDRLLLTYSV
jgi:DNA adenine methylase